MQIKFQTEIDEARRITIPDRIMSELHFKPGINLIIEKTKGKITIEPVKEENKLIEKDGVLIVGGKLTGDITDVVQKNREERIANIIKDSLK